MTEKERYYISVINSLYNQVAGFKSLKTGVSGSVIGNLNKAISSLQTAIESSKKAYSVDGIGVGSKNLETEKANISKIISEINGKVIPAIDSKINDINGSIGYYEYLLREERKNAANG